jgi:hypothetical protein
VLELPRQIHNTPRYKLSMLETFDEIIAGTGAVYVVCLPATTLAALLDGKLAHMQLLCYIGLLFEYHNVYHCFGSLMEWTGLGFVYRISLHTGSSI